MKLSRGVYRGSMAALMLSAASAFALDTATITGAALSPDCLAYRVQGICFWLLCTITGCSVETSVKVSHYVPDAVVSSCSNTGENPWVEVRFMSPPNPTALAGGDGTTNEAESLIPGLLEIGTRRGLNLWGNVYPRGGFLHQVDDHKAAAVVAQRAGDIVTRSGQPHVYQPVLAEETDGYWPAGELVESDESTGNGRSACWASRNTRPATPASRRKRRPVSDSRR